MVNTHLMKRVLCRPYEEITDIDDALAKYKSHASNVMDEKDDQRASGRQGGAEQRGDLL